MGGGVGAAATGSVAACAADDSAGFSGGNGASARFGPSAIAPAAALPLFGSTFFAGAFPAFAVADTFMLGGFAKVPLTPAVFVAAAGGFGASLKSFDFGELTDGATIGVLSGPDETLGAGSGLAAGRSVNAFLAGELGGAGVSAIVAPAAAWGSTAGACGSIDAGVPGVDAAALLPASAPAP